MAKICQNLGVGPVNLVFVIPENNLSIFKSTVASDKKSKVTQYVTTNVRPVSKSALMLMFDNQTKGSKKRKRTDGEFEG